VRPCQVCLCCTVGVISLTIALFINIRDLLFVVTSLEETSCIM
jgi:hypothetical protein